MYKCWMCGCNIKFYRRFLFNPDKDIYLPCPECGADVVDKERIPGWIFNFLIFGVLYIFIRDKVLALNFLEGGVLDASVLILYVYARLPLKKES
jgi:DNA-directed RNA polymerase subunit RPC12/RpoP